MCDIDMAVAMASGRGRTAWESALERFMILDGDTKPAKPNPHPPIGSGRKPRPPLLEIPNFTPPPPTPQPLFGFQKPQMNAYTQHLLQQQRQRLYYQEQQQLREQKQRQQEQQQAREQQQKNQGPPAVRTRRPKIWDLLPDSPEPAARTTQAQPQRECGAARAAKRTQHEPANTGAQSEPKHVAAHRGPRRASSDGEPAARLSMASESTGQHHEESACSASEKRSSRASLQCGVDLGMLWEAFYEALFFPAANCSTAAQEPASDSPCACHCSCQPAAAALAPAPGSAPDRFAPVRCQVEEEAIACPVACDEGLHEEEFTTPMGAGKGILSFGPTAASAIKGAHVHRRSPMSVLTPRSTEKSSAGSSPLRSPCPASLLAFIERDSQEHLVA